jgi:hypothetical protein
VLGHQLGHLLGDFVLRCDRVTEERIAIGRKRSVADSMVSFVEFLPCHCLPPNFYSNIRTEPRADRASGAFIDVDKAHWTITFLVDVIIYCNTAIGAEMDA